MVMSATRSNKCLGPLVCSPVFSSTTMISTSQSTYHFDSPDADVILKSSDAESPTEFRVHRCILALASPFFRDMFSLPQDPWKSPEKAPVISVSERQDVLRVLLQFVYPIPDPPVVSLHDLDELLGAAIKYEFEAVVASLRAFLISPQLLHTSPVKVYAIACQYELEDEAKVASRYTLGRDLLTLEGDELQELKKISAFDYYRLLKLHKERAEVAVALIKRADAACGEGVGGVVMCMQCNGPVFLSAGPPKWWIAWEEMAREELSLRPTTDVVFTLEFLYGAARKSGCPRCVGSIVESWKLLKQLRNAIDTVPSTI